MRTISGRFRHTPPSGNLEMGNYVFLKCWKKKFVQIYYISKNFHLAFYECYGSLTGYGSTVSTSFWPPGSGSNSQRPEAVLRIRINMFLGLPDPLVSGMDPVPSIIVQKSKKNLGAYYFVTLLDFLSLKKDVNFASKSDKQKKWC